LRRPVEFKTKTTKKPFVVFFEKPSFTGEPENKSKKYFFVLWFSCEEGAAT